jgi:comEA protein
MDTKRFVILISCLTALFSVFMVVYNFISQPPFGNANVAATHMNTSSVNINSLFVSDSSVLSSVLSSASSGIKLQSSSQILISSQGTSKSLSSSQMNVNSETQTTASNKTNDYPVNINTATKEQLDTLPDIGEVIAQRIIDYRTQNGNFTSIDQLDNIKGIGAKTIEKIKPYIIIK